MKRSKLKKMTELIDNSLRQRMNFIIEDDKYIIMVTNYIFLETDLNGNNKAYSILYNIRDNHVKILGDYLILKIIENKDRLVPQDIIKINYNGLDEFVKYFNDCHEKI